MAMYEPSAWVVAFKGDHDVAFGRDQDNVATWRVDFVKRDLFCWIKGRVANFEDGEVVPMQMDLSEG